MHYVTSTILFATSLLAIFVIQINLQFTAKKWIPNHILSSQDHCFLTLDNQWILD